MIYSASRIKSYKTCKRRWGFTYLLGKREPFAKAAQAGVEVHNLLEKNEFTGEEKWNGYDIGAMATVLRLATPANVVSREPKLDQTIDGIEFTGRIDFTTEMQVGDYKTTSQKRGIKSAATLEDDEQRLLYTRMTGLKDSIWLYGVWRDHSTHPVVILGNAKRDKEKFKLHVLQPCEEMEAIPADTDPLSLEANTMACGLYPPNGCPFLSECYDRHGSLITGVTKEMSILDTFKKPAEPVVEEPTAIVVANDNSKPIGTLYIDSYPISGVDNLTQSAPLIAKAAQSVCDDTHVLHSMLVDFGKGQYMLAAQLVHDIRASGQYYEHMFLESRSALGKACIFELSQLANVVVKGMI